MSLVKGALRRVASALVVTIVAVLVVMIAVVFLPCFVAGAFFKIFVGALAIGWDTVPEFQKKSTE